MRILFIFIILINCPYYSFAKASDDEVATLYRNSALGDHYRFHIGTFDSLEKSKKGRFDYNWGNCLIVSDAMQNRPGIDVKYWCEKGYFRK